MAVPFTRFVKESLSGLDGLPSFFGLDFASPLGEQAKAKLAQDAPFLPSEPVVRWVSGARVGLVRNDSLPSGMSDVKGFLEQAVVQRKGMSRPVRVSHFVAYNIPSGLGFPVRFLGRNVRQKPKRNVKCKRRACRKSDTEMFGLKWQV